MKRFDVTCAIISMDQGILVVQRSEKMELPLKWEFPGGKVELNESEEDCIHREIREELGIEIQLVSRLSKIQITNERASIQFVPFCANYISGEIQLLEHKQFQILPKDMLGNLDWAEADRIILKEYLNS